uniref:Uncharacterized protein n=1 Tax=Candidatus Methanophaga sp. ANME-1 ERB7 TaxID=2759913 RepID=A0A7G9ZAJ9_9EURY|nr:hypothetical protein HCLJFGEB_00027 [Methanosarcinales archaeon ANME-1 ERB7]
MKALPKFKSAEEEANFWDSFDTAQILEEGEENKDKEGYFVKIPDEIAQSLDVHEKERAKMWCMGKRIILEIG